jgi:hypothetical protein
MKKIYMGFLAIALALGANAQSIVYSLDKSYKGKGYQFNDPNPVSYSAGSADAILLNNDGSEYVGVKQLFSGDAHAITVLVKNKANGTRDSSFATNGVATENIQRGVRVNDIALLNNNKIYCSGSGWGGYVWSNGNMAPQTYAGGVVAPSEFSYDGCKHNDTTVVQVGDVNVIAFFKDQGNTTTNIYNNDGYSYVNFPTLSANTPSLQRVASVINGSYYVAGVVDTAAFIAKYNPRTFTLDNTWGNGGIVVIPVISSSINKFTDLKTQHDGKVVAVFDGFASGNGSEVNVFRFNTNGTLDNSFGTNGKLTQPNCNRVAFLPNNEIALLHQYDFGSTHQAGIIHLNNSGTILKVADFSLPTASGTNQENTPLSISANAAGDIAICGIMLDSASNTDKFFTMRLKRNVCNVTGNISNVGGTTATVNFSNVVLPVRVIIGQSKVVNFDQTVTTGNNVTATGLLPETEYFVQVTDDNGCTWETTFSTTNGTVDIKDVFNQISLSIYPNPANEFLVIYCNEEIESAEVYNLIGEQVQFVRGEIQKLNVRHLSGGMYTIQIKTISGKTVTERFIKQ